MAIVSSANPSVVVESCASTMFVILCGFSATPMRTSPVYDSPASVVKSCVSSNCSGSIRSAARSADRILKLAPEQNDALRDRGLAYLRLDHLAGARADLSLYLRREPDATDAAQVRERLIDLGGERPQLH